MVVVASNGLAQRGPVATRGGTRRRWVWVVRKGVDKSREWVQGRARGVAKGGARRAGAR